MDFLIFYEHVNREVENDTLIKYELERRGYTCDIIHFGGPGLHKYHKKRNRAKVVVTPWLRYNSNVIKYIQYAKKPYKLVNLQWEQVYNKRGITNGLVSTHDEAKKAYHTCWGENSRARLESMGVPAENLKIVGAIQQDYGRPLFEGYYLPRNEIAKKYELDSSKPWILFVSSFAYATFPEDAVKALADKYGEGIYKTVDFHKKSQSEFLNWVEEYLNVSDNEFIYRPHPSERVAARLDELKEKYPNFHVITDYSVKQWAKVSDRVNTWMSTSNAEILSLGIDYSIIRPFPMSDEMEVESMRDEIFVDTMEEFIRINTENLENSSDIAREKLQKLSHFYNYDSDKPAYVRMADYLEAIYKSETAAKFNFGIREHLYFRYREFKTRLASWIYEHAIKTKNEKFIDYLPIKKVIKENAHKAIARNNQKNDVENRMMEYLNNHG